MGYRPDEQSLDKPIAKILEGMEEFDAAAKQRIDSGDWQSEHCDELAKYMSKFAKLRSKLTKLRQDNW